MTTVALVLIAFVVGAVIAILGVMGYASALMERGDE